MMFRGTLVGKHWSRPGLISLARGIHSVPILLFHLPDQHLCVVKSTFIYIYIYIYICTYTYLIAYWWYVNYRYCQITVREQYFYTDRERCEMVTGYLSLGHRPGSDWTKCDTRQNVLQFCLQTGISSNLSCYQIFLLIAFLEEAFVRNIE